MQSARLDSEARRVQPQRPCSPPQLGCRPWCWVSSCAGAGARRLWLGVSGVPLKPGSPGLLLRCVQSWRTETGTSVHRGLRMAEMLATLGCAPFSAQMHELSNSLHASR